MDEEEDFPLPKPKTLVDFITEFMSWDNPLQEAFVLDAVYMYSHKLHKMTSEEIESLDKERRHVNMYARQIVARAFLRSYNEFYELGPLERP